MKRRLWSWPVEAAHLTVVVAASVAFAVMVGDMPDRVPVHLGVDGRPDRWGSPQEYWLFLGVLLFDLAVTWTSLAAVVRMRTERPEGADARWDALDRRRRRYGTRGLQWLMLGLDALLAAAWLVFAHAAAAGAHRLANGAALALAIAAPALIVGFLAAYVRGVRRIERGFEALGLPPTAKRPDAWRWGGAIYYAPDDPDVWVEKRYGFGWTLNFARPAAWAFLAVLLLPGVVITLLVWLT